jgi:histidinol-phosphate aminotransferase
VHGGLNFSELESLGLRPEDVTDFSASINPVGPSPRVLEAARNVNLASYPDPECLRLREAIGAALNVEPANILPGNGSTELIHLLARAFLSPDDTVVIFAPSFGEYAAACHTEGVEPVMLAPTAAEMAKGRFQWDLGDALDRIAELSPAVVFLCNPNNPTGVFLNENQVRSISEALQGTGILALDEAYISFVEDRWDSTHLVSLGNVALLRSMTKDYAVTGLRLGYLLSTEEIVSRVRRFQYSWSVNAPAQAAGIAALSDSGQLDRGRAAVREGKEFLAETARTLGIECAPAAANFLLLKVGHARELRLTLLRQHKICVRDCTSFGLPEYIRIGIRSMDDNRRLAEALRRILAERGIIA